MQSVLPVFRDVQLKSSPLAAIKRSIAIEFAFDIEPHVSEAVTVYFIPAQVGIGEVVVVLLPGEYVNLF
jgi:hypothetical protein